MWLAEIPDLGVDVGAVTVGLATKLGVVIGAAVATLVALAIVGKAVQWLRRAGDPEYDEEYCNSAFRDEGDGSDRHGPGH